jgi:Flp pilus assembly pilin Flp
MRILRQLAICSRGQDLVEYVLLLALMVIATTAALVTAGESLSSVWHAGVLTPGKSAPAGSLHK